LSILAQSFKRPLQTLLYGMDRRYHHILDHIII
jgi:hypothetical protein